MYKIGFLGVGKMGSSILLGIINSGIYKKDDILIYDPSEIAKEKFKEYRFVENEKMLAENVEILIVAVKPQIFNDLKKYEYSLQNTVIVSIVAGKTIKDLESVFGNRLFIRVMPNTPALIGKPIVAPLHNYVKDKFAALGIASERLHVIPPQSYLAFGYLTNHASAIVTDSGNVAEEATFLGIPCITLNTYAEHPETVSIGTNWLVGDDVQQLENALETLRKGEWKKGQLPERWDGRTSERIVQTLLEGASL